MGHSGTECAKNPRTSFVKQMNENSPVHHYQPAIILKTFGETWFKGTNPVPKTKNRMQ